MRGLYLLVVICPKEIQWISTKVATVKLQMKFRHLVKSKDLQAGRDSDLMSAGKLFQSLEVWTQTKQVPININVQEIDDNLMSSKVLKNGVCVFECALVRDQMLSVST